MPNPIDKLLGRDSKKKDDDDDDDGLKEIFADARRRRGVPPEGYASTSNQNERDEISSFFSNHPFFNGRSPFGVGGNEESPGSSLFENLMSHSQSSSSYQIHQDGKEVTIDVDLPGVSAKELKVEVLQNIQSCVVSWSGQRKQRNNNTQQQQQQQQQQHGQYPHQSSSSSSFSSFNNRLRLGPQVDCDQLTANLSHGILTMKAPVKELQETATVRNVEVTEREQN